MKAWQGDSGFNSSARSPHEQKMGAMLGAWRGIPLALMMMVAPIAAFAVLHLPQYAHIAAKVNATLSTIDSRAIRGQMQVPITLAHLLPVGVKGLMATMIVFFSFTCHDTYMHSWGSIFIQDVIMPFRKKPLSPKETRAVA